MSVTKDFQKLGLKIVPEVTDDRFSMVDSGGCENETGELLYGFIRRLKPQRVLTTGIYTGVSDLYIAQALKDNGFGKTTALEFESIHIRRAKELWQKMGVSEYITEVLTDSIKFEPKEKYQFIFCDTELNLRFHELVKFYPYLDEGGYILIHDMNRTLCQGNVNTDHPNFKHWPVGELSEDFKKLLKDGKLQQFFFGMARGMVGYYKVHKDDYIC